MATSVAHVADFIGVNAATDSVDTFAKVEPVDSAIDSVAPDFFDAFAKLEAADSAIDSVAPDSVNELVQSERDR